MRNIAERFKSGGYWKVFAICMGFMLTVYFSLYTNGLVNQWDGIWEYNYYKAGRWSISLGRWLWPFLDRAKMGLGIEPFATISCCALFSFGITLAFFLICNQNKASRRILLYAFMFLGSSSICISLSYRFMSATYGFAFLFSVLAVFAIVEIKNNIMSVIASGFLIAAQMGLYQAYLGCTGILVLACLILQLSNNNVQPYQIKKLIGRAIFSISVGGGLYLAGLKFCLLLTHTALASYKGIDNYSLFNTIRNFGSSIRNSYRVFFCFFFSNEYRTNLFMKEHLIYYILAITISIVLIVKLLIFLMGLFKKKIWIGILGTVLIILSPLAVNAVLLIATDADTSLQMTVALSLYLPVMLGTFDRVESQEIANNTLHIANCILVVLLSISLYGIVMQTHVDQEAMRSGMLCVKNMAELMTNNLKDDGYLNDDLPICVLGIPSGNKLYLFPKACEGANHYAVFGSWGTWSDRDSWQGVFHHLIGLNLEFASKEQTACVKSNAMLESMPCFPEEGYITEIDGVIVVKVSNVY